jgi:hypothetical protein
VKRSNLVILASLILSVTALSGCAGPFQYRGNPQTQASVASQIDGLQIQITNQLNVIRTQSSVTNPDINGEVCAHHVDPSTGNKAKADPEPSDLVCVELVGTVRVGQTEFYGLSPSDTQKLYNVDAGKIHFAFRDAAQWSTLHYPCWASDSTLHGNFNVKQEIQVDVTDRGGSLSFGCNVIKLK